MKIVIATNTNGIDRAFIKESEKKAQTLKRELHSGGWTNIKIEAVDCIMYETLKIKAK